MKNYIFWNQKTGEKLGVYQGHDAVSAYRDLLQDAGYFSDLLEDVGHTGKGENFEKDLTEFLMQEDDIAWKKITSLRSFKDL